MPQISPELLAMTHVCSACGHRKLKADFKSPRSKTCRACQSKPEASPKRSPGDREDLEELHRCRVVIAGFPVPPTTKE